MESAARRGARPILVPVLLLALVAEAASAEIYRWTDAAGNPHFTTSLDRVPWEQRAAARAAAAAPRRDSLQTFSASPAAAEAARAARDRTLNIPFQRHGHLMKVEARVNDELDVPFLIDTGASGVTLPRAVVARLGIQVDSRTPRVLVRTANGPVQVPLVTLESVQLGGARVENLSATVNDTLEIGLLGGSFFNNFVYGVDAAAGVISLQPNAEIVNGLRQEQWQERFRSVRDPLTRLELYLERRQLTSASRKRELEQTRAQLRERLEALEAEASRAGVPASWRQ